MSLHTRSLRWFFLATIGLSIALTSGCAVRDMVAPRGQHVSLAEFANNSGPDAPRRVNNQTVQRNNAPIAPAPDAPAPDAPSELPQPEAPASEQATPTPAPPVQQPDARRAMRPGETFVVDSLVGQVNGRPIFADAFFKPIEDQLVQLRRRTNDREFVVQAEQLIDLQLFQQIRDELFLTEAQAGLTMEERQGLFNFLRYLREQEIAMAGGTRAGAEQRLQEMEGMTVEDYIQGRLDQELVMKHLHEKIMPRVIVSWKDVQREYNRRANEFNPPPTLHISRIRLSNNETEKIERVKEMLVGGRSFEEAAEAIDYGETAWQTFVVKYEDDGLEEIEVADLLKQALLGKRIGETTQPIQLSTTTIWLHLERIERVHRSLYDLDVQRGLMAELYNRRLREEERKYIDSLFQRGIYDEVDVMKRRLLEIAVQRYGAPPA